MVIAWRVLFSRFEDDVFMQHEMGRHEHFHAIENPSRILSALVLKYHYELYFSTGTWPLFIFL